MPGWEIIGKEELDELTEIFTESSGVLFPHGFNDIRGGRFRVREFEKELSRQVFNKRKTLCTTSGTMAQYIVMKAMGIGPGDEVITQAFTFVATVETIVAIGATPVIVDIDESYNMDPNKLKDAITEKTKLIVPVHMLGNPCDMNAINAIAAQYSIPVLEDGCEAFGAKYKGKNIGTLSDFSVFSFDHQKTISTGEGGCIVSKSEADDTIFRQYHDHGHVNNPDKPRGLDDKINPGLNLRMNEMQAAVGKAQLKKLNFILEKNKEKKHILKSNISTFDKIKFRNIHDKDELADTLIFFFEDRKYSKKFVKAYNEKGYLTKNLPDAVDWHFSGRWNHMFHGYKNYETTWDEEWSFSRNLIERSMSAPIFINKPNSFYEKCAEDINKILRSI